MTEEFSPPPRRYEEPVAGPAFEVVQMIAGGFLGFFGGAVLAGFLTLLAWAPALLVSELLGAREIGVVGNVISATGACVLTIVAFVDVRQRALLCRAIAGRLTVAEVTLRAILIPLALATLEALAWIVWKLVR